jgi:hypothetical protein
MASNTTPPVDDQIPSLYLSDTFYTWFNNTNDLINKVNPIELYSITADTTGYLSPIQKDGITIDDLGNGNFKIGYILPTEITGGHTFTQHVRFLNGVSGDIVNFVNGRTGSAQAVTTISGNAITSTVDGVANVESVLFSINGVTATTAGAMTLDATDIPNTVAGTGPEGTILAATGGGSGAYSRKVEMFTALPDEEQIAIRVRGTTGGVGGRSPHVCFGYSSTRGVCADYLFWLNAENADGIDGSTLGGMLISGQHTLNNSPYDIVSDSRLYAGGNDGIEITSKMDHSSSDNFHVKFSSNQSGSGIKNKIGENTAHTVIYDSGTPEYAGMSLGVNAQGLLTSGLDIRGKVYDSGFNAAGAAGRILTSNGSDKVVWTDSIRSAERRFNNINTPIGGADYFWDSNANTGTSPITSVIHRLDQGSITVDQTVGTGVDGNSSPPTPDPPAANTVNKWQDRVVSFSFACWMVPDGSSDGTGQQTGEVFICANPTAPSAGSSLWQKVGYGSVTTAAGAGRTYGNPNVNFDLFVATGDTVWMKVTYTSNLGEFIAKSYHWSVLG